MTWPQTAVALLLLTNAAIWIYAFVSVGPEHEHRFVVAGVIFVLILTAFTVAALSAGGFW